MQLKGFAETKPKDLKGTENWSFVWAIVSASRCLLGRNSGLQVRSYSFWSIKGKTWAIAKATSLLHWGFG